MVIVAPSVLINRVDCKQHQQTFPGAACLSHPGPRANAGLRPTCDQINPGESGSPPGCAPAVSDQVIQLRFSGILQALLLTMRAVIHFQQAISLAHCFDGR